MPKKLSKDEANKLVESSKRGGRTASIIFGDDIEKLKKGEDLFISEDEWTVKTSMSSYYYGKFSKGIDPKDRKISYRKVTGGLLITKLK
jgi:hypothetical protein